MNPGVLGADDVYLYIRSDCLGNQKACFCYAMGVCVRVFVIKGLKKI